MLASRHVCGAHLDHLNWCWKDQPESGQHYFSLGLSTAQSGESGLSTKDACVPFFLLLEVTWSTVASFCRCDFPPVMNQNTELWTKISPLSPKLLAPSVFRRGRRKGSRAGNCIPIQISSDLQFSQAGMLTLTAIKYSVQLNQGNDQIHILYFKNHPKETWYEV